MGSIALDFITTSLNPCSLESIPEPIELADGKSAWLVIISCYQLEDDGNRQGRSDLYTIEVPHVADKHQSYAEDEDSVKFGNRLSLPYCDSLYSGILDGTWHPKFMNSNASGIYWYASAHSSGQISVHCLTINDNCNECASVSTKPPIDIKFSGQSSVPQPDLETQPLCLSLNWEASAPENSNRIVSSYSNGEVAVHDVALSSAERSAEITERHCWKAHTMFSNPAEVWSACFAKDGNGDIVLSGGDEGNLKIWDLRCPTSRPRQVLKPFDAGVTVVSAHPRLEHMVACGSYDETMCLIDLRFMSPQRPMFRSEPLGGGIWRIQWHPYNDDRILLAAMHGGCRIVQMNNVNIPSNESKPWISVVNEFTKHESMAYGADWLVWKDAEHDKCFDAAASCSFYDRAAYIWSAVDYQY